MYAYHWTSEHGWPTQIEANYNGDKTEYVPILSFANYSKTTVQPIQIVDSKITYAAWNIVVVFVDRMDIGKQILESVSDMFFLA